MNPIYLGLLTIFLYLSMAFSLGRELAGKKPLAYWWYFLVSFAAIGLHGHILHRMIDTPLGQNLDWILMLSFTAWLMNVFTLILSLRQDIKNLAILTYPFAVITLTLCGLSGYDLVRTQTQPEMLIHILVSLCALSILFMGFIQAILFSAQIYLLKVKPTSTILRVLPPLQAMESLLFFILTSGVVLLSGALGSGFIYGHFSAKHYLLPKVLLSVTAWGLLICLLIGRFLFGWRGPTAIRWTFGGVILAVLSYFGTKALLI